MCLRKSFGEACALNGGLFIESNQAAREIKSGIGPNFNKHGHSSEPPRDVIAKLWGVFEYNPDAMERKLVAPCVQVSSAKNHYCTSISPLEWTKHLHPSWGCKSPRRPAVTQ